MSEPFIYFERHHGGHIPFNAVEGESLDNVTKTLAGNSEAHKQWYNRALKGTEKDFNSRLET
ncbi:MAG: hypothetical protein ABEI13_01100, partial [Candidatus Paceibacteria bacterium]